jgi:hypothetical protein
MMAGILLFVILATIVISLTYIYASGLAGFFNAFEMHQTISAKNQEYLALSYTFNSATGLGNLTVTDAWAHPSRIVEVLKVSPSGGVSVIPEDVVIYPGQSYTFVNLLQKPYTYAVVTSYGNVWWSSFDMENPALGRYSLTMVASPPQGGTTSPPPGTYYYPYGTEVTISAAANPGWTFTGWTGTGNYSYTGTNRTVTIYVWNDMTETANFLAQPQPVTFAAKGLGSDAQGTVLTVTYTTSQYAEGGSHSYSYTFTASQLPVTLEIPTGTQVSYSWSSPVPGSTGVRYVWVSTSGLDNAQSGTFTVPAGGGQVVATYATQYLLTIQASPSYAGTTNPAPGSYWENAGAQVQISATANSGYEFYEWVGSGSGSYSGTSSSAMVTMNGPITETAVFYVGVTLNAAQGGSASASWSGGSASVGAGQSTTFYVPAGTTVQFSASPNSGWVFAGWTGSGTGSYSGTSNPVSVTVNYPISETANFNAGITFSVTGMGSDAQGTVLTVDGTGYSYSQLPVTFYWAPGSQHSFSWSSPVSSSTSGKRYVWVSTSGLSTSQSGTITVSGPGSVTASYATQYLLTMAASPSYAGTTNPAPGSYWYNAGSSVQISATANSKYQFYEWVGSGSGSYSGTSNPATVTMNGPVTETAYFNVEVTLAAQAGGSASASWSGGSASVSGPGSTTFYVPAGTTVQFTATPDNGVTFAGWSGSGTGSYSGPSNPVSVTVNYPINETADFAVVITFEENGLGPDATGTVVTVDGVSYSYTGSQALTTISVPYGSQVSYSYAQYVYSTEYGKRYVWTATTGLQTAQSATFTATQGGTIIGWYGGPNGQVGIQYLLTIGVSPSGAGTTNPAPGSYWYNAGSQVQISATANSGYQFYKWVGSGSGSYSGQNNPATVTMNGPVNETAMFYLQVTFSEQGLPSNLVGTVVQVVYGGQTYSLGVGQLPWTIMVPYGAQLSYAFTQSFLNDPTQGVEYNLSAVQGLSTVPSATMTVTQPGSVTGVYTAYYLVTTQPSPSGGGTTSPAQEWVQSGATVALTASPASGWGFLDWSGTMGSSPISSASNPWYLTVTGPVDVTGYFGPGLTVSATQGGTVTVSANGVTLGIVQAGSSQTFYVSPGTTVTLDAEPSQGYQFTGWSGALSGTADPDSITVNAPASVTADFAPQISFPFLTAYDAINSNTGYNYWVAAVGQVSGYSGQLMLVFDITSAANGQTYTVSTTVTPNAQGWFYTGVLTIGGGYSVWGQGVSAKSLTIYAQYGGIWVPVTTSNGWPWGVETYLDTSGDGSWTVSVPNWDNIVLAQASSSTGSVNTLLPQETTVQLTATPASGWYLDQFSTSYTPYFGATSHKATYNANPATVTTPSVGTAAGSGGYIISATFKQTQVTFYVYSPMWTSISFTLYITEPNGSTIAWSTTTSLTINGWMASKTWTGLPLGNYFWDIVPSSYNGYQATPDAGAFTLETGGGTVQETITYGNQQLYYVEFSDWSSLPYNTTWWVDFNGINFSAPSQDDIIFYNVPVGIYPYSSGPNPYYPPGTSGVRYYASDSNGTVDVGPNKLVYIIYTTQYEATVTYTPANAYSTGTSPAPSSNGVATTWVDAGSSFTVTAYPATYWYVYTITGSPPPSSNTPQYIQTGGVWVGRNTWNNVQSPISATVKFAPVQVNVQESGLPSGTTWSVSYAGNTYYAQAGQMIQVQWDENPNDNTLYPQIIPYGNGEYVPSPSSIQFPTSENPNSPPTVTVSYTYYYAITINAGPDGSVSWVTGAPAIPSSSGTVPAGSSQTIYYSSAGSSAIQLTANPNPGYVFSSWSISGGLSYQFGYGPTSNPVTLSVSGSGSVTANWNIKTYSVTFNENGLPLFWTWNVTFNGQTQSATNDGAFGGYTITFNNVPPGTYYFTIPSQGSYVPSPSSGWVTVSSSNVTVYVTFSQSTYSYTWYESGLPSGDTWYISVAGNTYSAPAGQSITVNGLSGSQSWSTWDADGYTPNPGSGTVSGAGSTTITFTQSTYSYTWYESGLPSGTMWGITIGITTQWSSSTSLTWSGLSGTNSWSVDAPSGYTANPSSGTVSGAGSTTITFTGIPQIQVSINPQPTSGTAPLQVTLYASWWGAPSGSTYSYTINWGDGSTTSSSTTSTTGTFTHTYSSAGTYTITMTVSAPGAQTGSASATVTVYAPLTISSFSANPTSGIAPLTVSFSGSWSGGSGGYSWTLSFGDGQSTSGSGSSVSTSHTYSSAGTYTATLTVTDSAGHTTSQSVTITVSSSSTYSVTFTETGLPTGTTWWAQVGGTTKYAGAGQSITFNGLSGSQSWSVESPVTYYNKYTGQTYYYYAHPSSGTVSSGGTISITYNQQP